MTDQESASALSAATREIEDLKHRVLRLEHFTQELPDTWLLSPSFLKRAFGVLGLYVVASLVIAIHVYVLITAVLQRLAM
jgi:hypothetical protein